MDGEGWEEGLVVCEMCEAVVCIHRWCYLMTLIISPFTQYTHIHLCRLYEYIAIVCGGVCVCGGGGEIIIVTK